MAKLTAFFEKGEEKQPTITCPSSFLYSAGFELTFQ